MIALGFEGDAQQKKSTALALGAMLREKYGAPNVDRGSSRSDELPTTCITDDKSALLEETWLWKGEAGEGGKIVLTYVCTSGSIMSGVVYLDATAVAQKLQKEKLRRQNY
jgi:hypothetical protein